MKASDLDCASFSNSHAILTGFRAITTSESSTEPTSPTFGPTIRRWYPPAARRLQKDVGTGEKKAVLPFVVAVAALFLVWGLVILVSVFFALPVAPPTGFKLNSSDKANNSNETGTSRTRHGVTCPSLFRWDSSTNSCYIPCTEWDWRTESEKKVNLAISYVNITVSLLCAIVTAITWIRLRHT
jgi:hypothetical protein